MKLASNPPRCETNAQLAAWLQVTALNIARNMLIAEHRRNQRETSYAGSQLRADRPLIWPLGSIVPSGGHKGRPATPPQGA